MFVLMVVQKPIWNSGKKIRFGICPRFKSESNNVLGKYYILAMLLSLFLRYPLLAIMTSGMLTWMNICWSSTAVLCIHWVSVVTNLHCTLNPTHLILLRRGTGAASLSSIYHFMSTFLMLFNSAESRECGSGSSSNVRISLINHQAISGNKLRMWLYENSYLSRARFSLYPIVRR